MIIEDVVGFLKKNPPFQFLDEATLRGVAGSLSMEFYPRDTLILKQHGPPSESVWIIKKGAVKVSMRSDDGDEVVMDYKGEGDNFGFLSMIGRDRQKTNVVTVDDTICYILGREKVSNLLESSPAFAEYFMSYLSRYVDRTYSEMHKKSLLYGSAERLLFTTKVGDIATGAVTVDEDLTIKEAAGIMAKNRISSLIILDKRRLPVGIITDRDLREKVVARGRSIEEPVRNIMTISLIRADADDFCFEAVLKMIKYNIHHILVIKEGELHGIMTNHDLMMLQGTSPLSIAHNVDNQQNIYGLVSAAGRINNLLGLLLKEGAKALSVSTIVTEINDRLIRKVLELAERQFGQPPVPYCWVVLGTEGRKEQIFKTDQDNGIIYADPAADDEEVIAKYFAGFTAFVKDCLLQIGYPPCPESYSADNPLWCQPIKTWKTYFTGWINEPAAESVMRSLIFFDMRPVYGKSGLSDELKDHFLLLLRDSTVFLGRMADVIVKNTPPIGILKSFVVEKGGEHKDKIDLKLKGLRPLVDAVRLFALEKGIKETSTIERLRRLRGKSSPIEDRINDLEHIFEYFMQLRIHHRFGMINEGKAPDNFINPNSMSSLEKKTMKEAFHLISGLQVLITEKYKPFIK
ncbi:MAG: cyclic nucleotide-binding/CBS domain-containing protein [Nitrospirae bacterium]|nr:cyclic nucleotide-binding/CBS domain-containing protein [Nitrospirota bacterium]